MKEQEFQLELERFKQKASWEKMIFYLSITTLWGIILIFLTKKISARGDLNLIILRDFLGTMILWILALAVIMVLGEFLVQNYLDTQANILRKKVVGKNAKVWNDKKIRQLVVLEKGLTKRKNNIEGLISKINNLKNEIFGGKK